MEQTQGKHEEPIGQERSAGNDHRGGPEQRRLLLVHAHPDDETLTSGATMAKYAAEGARVTLVTCTSGEEGEILLPEISHLAADQHDGLGPHRLVELAEAMGELGVSDHRMLGGPGRYRDSGMMGTAANDREDCFWRADLGAAAAELVGVIREVRPQVMITYDDFGGYGHPDHIQAHRVAMYAVMLAAVNSYRPDLGAAWIVEKVYWAAFPRSVLSEAVAKMDPALTEQFLGEVDLDTAPFLVDDEVVTTRIDGREQLEAKLAAMRAHASQIDMEGPFFALSAVAGPDALGLEYYRLAQGTVSADGRYETDLFAGTSAE